MRRYWLETKDLISNSFFQIEGENFHHIFGVCRQQVGSKFEVLTDESKAYFVEVTEVTRKSAQAVIIEQRAIAPLPEPHIHLVLSLSRFAVMDAVVEKAVEMGVKSIQPVFSEFSFVRKGEKLSPNKLERWDKIVRSATQQSGRGDLMKIHSAAPLEDFLKTINPSAEQMGLFAYEGDATHGIKSYLAQRLEQPKKIWLFVGSEGGFSYQEVETFKKHQLDSVTIGSQILRVETACIALVSALKYEFDLMR